MKRRSRPPRPQRSWQLSLSRRFSIWFSFMRRTCFFRSAFSLMSRFISALPSAMATSSGAHVRARGPMEVEIQSPQALEKQPQAPELHGCPAFRSLVTSPALKEPVTPPAPDPPTPPADLASGASAHRATPPAEGEGRGGHRDRWEKWGRGSWGGQPRPRQERSRTSWQQPEPWAEGRVGPSTPRGLCRLQGNCAFTLRDLWRPSP